jgi:hypothetical protein
MDKYFNPVVMARGVGSWLRPLSHSLPSRNIIRFVLNRPPYIYFLAICITVLAVLSPNTKVAWNLFKGRREAPDELNLALSYTD